MPAADRAFACRRAAGRQVVGVDPDERFSRRRAPDAAQLLLRGGRRGRAAVRVRSFDPRLRARAPPRPRPELVVAGSRASCAEVASWWSTSLSADPLLSLELDRFERA
jgi:hypothetical protein